MNILVIDTATEACSAALSYQGQVLAKFEVCPQQHSQRLLPMVDELLAEAGITLKNLELLGFGRGPGSFTGVRIATGMIQGLALGSQLPVVPVSTLAAMAQQAYIEHGVEQVIAAIDARMDEVYMGKYTLVDGTMQLVGDEAVLPPEQALSGMVDIRQWAGVGTAWGTYESLNPDGQVRVLSDILYPSAQFMLPLATRAAADGAAVSVDHIEPVYLRDKVTWKKLPGRE